MQEIYVLYFHFTFNHILKINKNKNKLSNIN